MPESPENFRLDDRPIKSLGWWFEPDFNSIEVGHNGITAIRCSEQYCGEYSIIWVEVWKGKNLSARYNARNIDTITYIV